MPPLKAEPSNCSTGLASLVATANEAAICASFQLGDQELNRFLRAVADRDLVGPDAQLAAKRVCLLAGQGVQHQQALSEELAVSGHQRG